MLAAFSFVALGLAPRDWVPDTPAGKAFRVEIAAGPEPDLRDDDRRPGRSAADFAGGGRDQGEPHRGIAGPDRGGDPRHRAHGVAVAADSGRFSAAPRPEVGPRSRLRG